MSPFKIFFALIIVVISTDSVLSQITPKDLVLKEKQTKSFFNEKIFSDSVDSSFISNLDSAMLYKDVPYLLDLALEINNSNHIDSSHINSTDILDYTIKIIDKRKLKKTDKELLTLAIIVMSKVDSTMYGEKISDYKTQIISLEQMKYEEPLAISRGNQPFISFKNKTGKSIILYVDEVYICKIYKGDEYSYITGENSCVDITLSDLVQRYQLEKEVCIGETPYLFDINK